MHLFCLRATVRALLALDREQSLQEAVLGELGLLGTGAFRRLLHGLRLHDLRRLLVEDLRGEQDVLLEVLLRRDNAGPKVVAFATADAASFRYGTVDVLDTRQCGAVDALGVYSSQ